MLNVPPYVPYALISGRIQALAVQCCVRKLARSHTSSMAFLLT
jgi:hypothetical protein